MLKINLDCGNKLAVIKTGNASKVLIRLKIRNVNSIGENKMPFIIAGVVKSMAFSFLGNSGVIEKVIILLLETLAKKTDSDVDDKLVALLKKSLVKKTA